MGYDKKRQSQFSYFSARAKQARYAFTLGGDYLA